jgi:unsaturated rhamnogalacturonyl hydrolase
LLHIQYLFDAKTGLFHHGWTFEEGGHNFANAAWGRGNRCESRRRGGCR